MREGGNLEMMEEYLRYEEASDWERIPVLIFALAD